MCSGEDYEMNSDEESNPEQYIVEKVVGKKVFRGEVYYRIKWKDYPNEDNTWEPERNCAGASSLIREYEEKERQKRRTVGAVAEGKKLKSSNSDREAAGRRKTDVSETSRTFQNLTIVSENVTNKSTVKGESDEEFFPDESDHRSGKKIRPKNASSCVRVKRRVAATRPRYDLDSDSENQPEPNVHREDFSNDFDTTLTGQINANSTENNDMDCTTTSTCSLISKSILRKYSASEIDIVGAVPTNKGVIIGVKAKNSDEVVRFDSKEVTNLWPQLYVSFLERHIVFDEK